jgi:hypothetical protein
MDRHEWEIRLNHKEYKEETRQRYGEPIEYVLSRLKQGKEIDLFDIINAKCELKELIKKSNNNPQDIKHTINRSTMMILTPIYKWILWLVITMLIGIIFYTFRSKF